MLRMHHVVRLSAVGAGSSRRHGIIVVLETFLLDDGWA